MLVIKSFIDKGTGKGYNEGSTFESNDSERVAFLVKNGFLQASEKPKRSRKSKDGE